MDRQLVYKSSHNITLRQKVNKAQNLYLGDAQIRGAGALAPWTQTATVQRPVMLSTMNITSDTPAGDITNITVLRTLVVHLESISGPRMLRPCKLWPTPTRNWPFHVQ